MTYTKEFNINSKSSVVNYVKKKSCFYFLEFRVHELQDDRIHTDALS